MRRLRRKTVRFLARVGMVIFVALIALVVWQSRRDPFAALPAPEALASLRHEQSEVRGARLVQHVRLDEPRVGAIGLALNLPEPLPDHALPVLVVLGGLGTGEENIRHIPDPGPNALLGYDWPVSGDLPEGLRLIRALPDLYSRILASPGQMAAALEWVAAQPWADPERITLMGFSLGTLTVPAIQRLAETRGLSVGWTVLAYGGAPIGDLLAAHPNVPSDWMRPVLGAFAELLFRPLEPLNHLPHVKGRFLVMAGEEDRLIPAAASDRLILAVPDPKTVLRFDGDHMGVGPGQQALLDRIIAASGQWLIEQGAVRVPDNSS